MEPISLSLRELLVGQGIANGRAGTRANGGIGAGDQSGGTDRLLTAQAEREAANRSGMGKGRQPKPAPVDQAFGGQHRFGRSQGGPVLRVYGNPNAHRMQARKPAVRSATFLTCIEGGKR